MGTLHPSTSCPDFKFPSLRSASHPNSHNVQDLASMAGSVISPDIQSHMYESFLHGRTADVALHVRGSWEAVYRLHRVVLIQAGFFRSLFDGGFRESSPRLASHFHGPEEVNITFDDPNITRAAFEICIARLYGGGPPLYVDPDLMPTPTEPLTPSYPHPKKYRAIPAGHHPASSRFLLSLLATSVYLSIAHVIKQALTLILKSIGPHTVVLYLNFSIGEGIGDKLDNEPEAGVGLEHVAQTMPRISGPMTILTPMAEVSEAYINEKFEEISMIQKEGPSDLEHPEMSSLRTETASVYSVDGRSPSYSYGTLSNKIGESAACWLIRWGKDILAYEEPQAFSSELELPIAGSVPSLSSTSATFNLWSRRGLNSKWACAILSSDSFFIGSERERYSFACRVVELRRRDGIRNDEERDWEELFSSGIHYMHMSREDLMMISRDVSPTRGTPYVPLTILQAALWDQSSLCQIITAGSSPQSVTTPTRSPSALDEKLGLAATTAEIRTLISSSSPNKEVEAKKTYHPVPGNSSVRIGDGVGRDTVDLLLDPPAQTTSSIAEPVTVPSAENFFGMLSLKRTASSCVVADKTGEASWSPFPPFRFAVEFWGAKDKSRLYSHTIWYAGSLYNVYAQVVRKKGNQLGVYLHRQSSVDTIPLASTPPVVTHLPRGLSHRRGGSIPGENVSIPTSPSTHSIVRPSSSGTTRHAGSRSTTPVSTPTSSRFPLSVTLPSANSPSLPWQPYRDPRSLILAYFSIHCASATGSSLTRFSSAPDEFSIGQSWGWKSSSLRTDEYVEVSESEDVVYPKEVSLRATVVIGLV